MYLDLSKRSTIWNGGSSSSKSARAHQSGQYRKKRSKNLSEALSQIGHAHFYSLTENQPTATKYRKPAPNL